MASWDLRRGDCAAILPTLDADSVDAIVTDPPYGLEFMGHDWDRLARPSDANGFRRASDPSQVDRDNVFGRVLRVAPEFKTGLSAMQEWHTAWAVAALRVAKPGAHLVAFGGTRTWHRLAVALEDAGWEIRDTLCWLYGQGFPKSHNLHGDWEGWGTALKPAWEPIVLARKPLIGTVADNLARYGVGALNIDGCRIAFRDRADATESSAKNQHADFASGPRANHVYGADHVARTNYAAIGRWPANLALDEDAAAMLDQQSGVSTSLGGRAGHDNAYSGGFRRDFYGDTSPGYGDRGGASRFFYCGKASPAERNGNPHPTVKPLALMAWLCRLVTPPGGLILDPFAGSASTGVAALRDGFRFLGVERDPGYVDIARARLAGDAPLLESTPCPA